MLPIGPLMIEHRLIEKMINIFSCLAWITLPLKKKIRC